MGGFFNVPLSPDLDTSSGSSLIPYKALRRIKKGIKRTFPYTTLGGLYTSPKKTLLSFPLLTINTPGLTLSFCPKLISSFSNRPPQNPCATEPLRALKLHTRKLEHPQLYRSLPKPEPLFGMSWVYKHRDA